MNATPSIESTVATIATEIPGAAAVFERHGIDYCCGGKMPLWRACQKRGLDPGAVLAEVERRATGEPAGAPDWAAMGMAELSDHIEGVHHAYLKAELPRLGQLAAKVAGVHGAGHPRLRELSEAFSGFSADMFSHMAKEEQVLFPALRAIERGERPFGGAIEGPIACMTDEHDEAGIALAKFRSLTDGYAPPMHACNSWRVLLGDLARLEKDMHQHVHKENNILFPKGLAAAGRSGGGGACGCVGG
ncbi:MAG TPA: iron-sulfur cluster repair di-iron protein [Phycisphaerales bacterium]|nr:iron-sulfur cluster repair di-iron protein [Phycisphaerales bacterium]